MNALADVHLMYSTLVYFSHCFIVEFSIGIHIIFKLIDSDLIVQRVTRAPGYGMSVRRCCRSLCVLRTSLMYDLV